MARPASASAPTARWAVRTRPRRLCGAPLDFRALRAELDLPDSYPQAALDQARRAAGGPHPPADDRTDLALVTVDPAGSMDLDQAMHLARDGDGYLVNYAIADVAAFVDPGTALDEETHRRGQTVYFPDTRIPLHPPVLSEGAASLLPGQVAPAVLWQIGLDAEGAVTTVAVSRARVSSVARLDYAGLQADLDAGRAHPSVELLTTVGELLETQARRRHAIDLDLPEQEVRRVDGHWTITARTELPAEIHNAHISVLTGMAAASMMLDGGYGILRTVPPPAHGAVNQLRRAARALGIDWPKHAEPGDVLATVRRDDPREVTLVDHAASLLRGSGYTAFDGDAPAQHSHAGIGAPYAHVTAPLRRLVDRYAAEICLALHAGERPPDWVRDYLPALPEVMAETGRVAHTADREVIDLTEAWLLQHRIGQQFDVLVIDGEENAATVLLDDPAVRARCQGSNLPVGEWIRATLVTADVATRRVRFAADTPDTPITATDNS